MTLLDAPGRETTHRDMEPTAPPRRWRLLVLLFPALIAAGLAAGWLVDPGPHQSLVQYGDDVIRNWVMAHRTTAMVHLLHPVTALGARYDVAVAALVLSVLLLLFRRRWQALVPLLAVGGADVLVVYVKYTVGRPGPASTWLHSGEPAFPSGHTAGITALVVPLAVLAWRSRRWWWPAVAALLLIALMAVTLLVLDAHWLSDIVASAVLVGAWSAAVAAWLPSPRSKREHSRFGISHEPAAHASNQRATAHEPSGPIDELSSSSPGHLDGARSGHAADR